jgi:hypothetical protein
MESDMNVKELQTKLAELDPEMEVIVECFSDYDVVNTLNIIHAVPQNGYIMRTHRTMSIKNAEKQKKYVYIGCFGE